MSHDCDQSQRVFLQNITLRVSFFFCIIIYIFNRDFNYIHYYSA